MIDLKVLNKHTYVSGTMTCKSCKTLIVLKGKLSKAQMKGLCRRRCDGTLRGRDGLPTDPVIRQQVIEQSQEKKRITLERRKAKRRARLAKQKKEQLKSPISCHRLNGGCSDIKHCSNMDAVVSVVEQPKV